VNVDKVTVTGHYDAAGQCRQVFVYLNSEVVTARDVAEAVRAVFRPEPTQRDGGFGDTKAYPFVGLNGNPNPAPQTKNEREWFKE
jgi:hypothetical protein